MSLPAAAFFTLGLGGSAGSSALNDWLAADRQVIGAADESELTIASGSVTATIGMHTLDTESDAASDDLTNILVTGMAPQLLLVRAENAARVVTLKHESGGAGQMSFGDAADCILDATTKYVLFWIDTGASPVTLREVARFGFGPSSQLEANTAASGSPNILTAGEVGKVFTNEGAGSKNYHTLPAARAGLGPYTFVVQDADGMRIVAGAGDTIRIAASVSAGAGLIECTTIGNTVTLIAINATEWVAISYVGTWTVT